MVKIEGKVTGIRSNLKSDPEWKYAIGSDSITTMEAAMALYDKKKASDTFYGDWLTLELADVKNMSIEGLAVAVSYKALKLKALGD